MRSLRSAFTVALTATVLAACGPSAARHAATPAHATAGDPEDRRGADHSGSPPAESEPPPPIAAAPETPPPATEPPETTPPSPAPPISCTPYAPDQTYAVVVSSGLYRAEVVDYAPRCATGVECTTRYGDGTVGEGAITYSTTLTTANGASWNIRNTRTGGTVGWNATIRLVAGELVHVLYAFHPPTSSRANVRTDLMCDNTASTDYLVVSADLGLRVFLRFTRIGD